MMNNLDDFTSKLESLKTRFDVVTNTMKNSYADHKLKKDSSIYLGAKNNLSGVLEDLGNFEIALNKLIGDNNTILDNVNKKINRDKNIYERLHKKYNQILNENHAGETLKIDKYNQNIEEYFKTYFYIFSIILMTGFLLNKIKN